MEGIVEIVGANAAWMDPAAVLSRAYSAFEVSRGRYYSRSCFDNQSCSAEVAADVEAVKGSSRKRKRKRAAYEPNEKELLAELRHQDARCAILNAHSSFLKTTYAEICPREIMGSSTTAPLGISKGAQSSSTSFSGDCDLSFRQLAEVWQAPLYELNILKMSSEERSKGGPDSGKLFFFIRLLHQQQDHPWLKLCAVHHDQESFVFMTKGKSQAGGPDEEGEAQVSRSYRLFNSFIENVEEEAVAECEGALFLLPKDSRFLISDVSQVHQLISHNNEGSSNPGYNVIVIDPPWENKSVRRNSLYPTMPNRQLFSLPVRRLAHSEGALVALWLTNREKLHQFVKKELFPAWGVTFAATWYWLKLNPSGQMISPLDLQHHKPYECLVLGYLLGSSQEAAFGESPREDDTRKAPESLLLTATEKFVLMSVPGDHSRKPPLGSLLAKYSPGPRPIRGMELFARELHSGWTSWGNEPLHFQNLKYFQHRT